MFECLVADEVRNLCFACSLQQAEAMSKGIAAERGGSMARMLEHLLALGAERLYLLEGCMKVVNMEVEMDRRPVTVEFAPITGAR